MPEGIWDMFLTPYPLSLTAKEGKWWNGIHAGLKILWLKGRVGSTPTLPRLGDKG